MIRQPQIGIFGLGAIGSVMAYHLGADSNNQLYYFNRSERMALRLQLPDGQKKERLIYCQKTKPDKSLDWLIVCLKEYQTVRAIPDIQQLLSTETRLVILRNGLQHTLAFAEIVSAQRLLPLLIDCPTQRNPQGLVEQLRPAKLTAPATRLGADFGQLLATSQLNLQLSKEFKTASWLKLIESAAIGAITSLTGQTCHIFKDSHALAVFQTLIAEAIRVAKADGAQIPDNYNDLLLVKVQQYPAHKGSSMLSDRLAGKPIELGAKNGVISQLGQYYALPTPSHDLVCALLSTGHQISGDLR